MNPIIKTIQPYIAQKLVNEGVHPDYPNLRIYNYSHKCQIERAWDETTLQCRGLIMDSDTGEILARPFPKFFNLGEREVDIPKEEPRIYEKYDGSLGILYWVSGEPHIATRGSFTSDQAIWASEWFKCNAGHSDAFHRDRTYLFEIVYPANRIVVQYDFEGLVLLAVRDTKTGKELWQDDLPEAIKIPKPYPPMALDQLWGLERDNAEGFVVLYPNSGLRIKLKFEEYIRLHRIVTNVTPRSIWDALRNGSDLSEILERVPDEFYDWVKKWKAELMLKFVKLGHYAGREYQRVKHLPDRKEQAEHIIKWDKQYAGIVFAMLDDKPYEQIIWRHLKPETEAAFKKEI